jgi:hypothetical protein
MAKTRMRLSGGRGWGRSNRLGAVEVIGPQLHRSWWVQALLAVWRCSIEITLAVLLLIAWFRLHAHMPSYAVACVMAFPLVALCNFRLPRRWIVGWFYVLVVRHRLRTALVQLGSRNRSGKLPWLIWWHPTPVRERVWLCLVEGMSAAQIEEAADALAAACFARQVRVETNRRMTVFVRVDIIRRDPLESPTPITSRLMAKLGRTQPQPPVVLDGDSNPSAGYPGSGYGPGAYGAASLYRATGLPPAYPPADITNKPKRPPRDDGPDDGGLSEYV